ncbi:SprT-like family-domain-containing protein, partial [Tirmania nivea]
KSFRSRKQALADQFLLELDFRVTSNRVYQKLSHLGGLKVVWSKNLLKTAGYFKYRYKRSARVDEDGEHLPGEHRIITFAQIELAEKVVDDEHRLYSTLAHEFAHAANAVVGENWDQRCHGKGFKQWLLKCQKAFPERAIELGSCHNYVISYKYQWACIGRWANADGTWGVEDGCGYVVKRHSRSVDVEIHRCPTCVGRLMQTLPKPVGGGAPQGLTEYQAFMQERMKVVRRDNPGMPQKEVMRLVGLEWRGKKERGEVGLGKSDGKEKGREKEKGRARMEVIEISDDDGDNMGVGLTDRLDGLRI